MTARATIADAAGFEFRRADPSRVSVGDRAPIEFQGLMFQTTVESVVGATVTLRIEHCPGVESITIEFAS